MAPPKPAARVPLGPPLRLSAAAEALARLTRADVLAAQAYWRTHAVGLPDLLDQVLPPVKGSP